MTEQHSSPDLIYFADTIWSDVAIRLSIDIKVAFQSRNYGKSKSPLVLIEFHLVLKIGSFILWPGCHAKMAKAQEKIVRPWCDEGESSDDQAVEYRAEARARHGGKQEVVGRTENGEVPPVDAQPTALPAPTQSFLLVPVVQLGPPVAIPILRAWPIFAPEEFIQEKQDRCSQVLDSVTPWIGGKATKPYFQVWIQEIPASRLRCAECSKANGLCIENHKGVDPGLCPICERHRCAHGAGCTRKNFACKWCHFDGTGECFFSKKDKRKFILKDWWPLWPLWQTSSNLSLGPLGHV